MFIEQASLAGSISYSYKCPLLATNGVRGNKSESHFPAPHFLQPDFSGGGLEDTSPS